MKGKKLAMSGNLPSVYGKIGTKDINREVYGIWLSRNDELHDIPALNSDPINFYEVDFEAKDYMHKIWDLSDLNDVQRRIFIERILLGATLESLASKLRVTSERIRQIEVTAIRKLKKSAECINKGERARWPRPKIRARTLVEELLAMRIAA
jgi:hypothetical protein